ncbi:MAG: hypothetical protein PQ975_03370 [Methanobacterium sp.]|jgi:UPF0288 family protein (methanogenesis marker protein 3)
MSPDLENLDVTRMIICTSQDPEFLINLFKKKVDSIGEPFDGTNVVGMVVKGLENLEKFKEGDIVYVARS